VNARGVTRLGLLAFGLALSAAVACDAQELLPATDAVVTATSSIESTALTSDDGGVIAGFIPDMSKTSAQYMGGGCERERRPNCSRPGRRSTRR
jgi:ABC-type amino acid transport substrate-binding protein